MILKNIQLYLDNNNISSTTSSLSVKKDYNVTDRTTLSNITSKSNSPTLESTDFACAGFYDNVLNIESEGDNQYANISILHNGTSAASACYFFQAALSTYSLNEKVGNLFRYDLSGKLYDSNFNRGYILYNAAVSTTTSTSKITYSSNNEKDVAVNIIVNSYVGTSITYNVYSNTNSIIKTGTITSNGAYFVQTTTAYPDFYVQFVPTSASANIIVMVGKQYHTTNTIV